MRAPHGTAFCRCIVAPDYYRIRQCDQRVDQSAVDRVGWLDQSAVDRVGWLDQSAVDRVD
ncbi:hypothetical protein [Arthrobacter sp. NicSoilB8]|uniref:hypothetical protein n=1 Tax=Arthrobacter sp. NicSoilB8 TaxID=2830998 RepID=UPI001CC65D51|nr:hypothetical protein [Arthrobacter sp. NicSoilB8]BCW71106.1 hypothetical protein NicSoilB8_21500 [Arthrobacter sp. NicSoilB8]